MNPINTPLTEQEFEKQLESLPRFQMSARGDELFYSKLNAVLAAKRNERYAYEDQKAPTAWFGFRRFAYSFGLGLFVVAASFTGLSYRDSVTYGSVLYPVKQTAEQVEGLAAFTTEQKVETELRFADRRLREGWEIVGTSGDTAAWLIQTAYAAGPVTSDSAKAKYLKQTLTDMNKHVNNASRIVESQALDAVDAVALLDTITQRADDQVASLKQMRTQASVENKLAVHMAASSEERYLVKLIVAREDIREVAEKQGKNTRVQLAQFSTLMPTLGVSGTDSTNGFTAREATNIQAARSALSLLEEKVKLLPASEQARMSARVVEAQRALSQGKTGTAYGLSIALSKQVAEARGVISSNNGQVASVRVNNQVQATPRLLPDVQVGPAGISINQRESVNVSAQNAGQNVQVNQQAVNVPSAVGGVSVFDLLDRNPQADVQVQTPRVNVQQQQAVQVQNNQPVSITPTNVYITPDMNVNFAQPQVNVQMPTPQMEPQVQVQPNVQINLQPTTSINVAPSTSQVQVNGGIQVELKPLAPIQISR